MSGFEFRLQSLWKLRCAERDERREALANAYRANEILTGQLAELQDNLTQLRRDLGACAGGGPVDVDRLLNTHRFELVLEAQAAQLEQQRQGIAVEVERRRQALVTADQAVRTVEKLRERKLAEHLAQEARREQQRLDEIGTRRVGTYPGGDS